MAEVYESLSALEPSFDHNQFGCRQNRSTTPAMVAVTHAWQSALDRGWAVRTRLLYHNSKYKLLCPRGTQTCALAVANIKVNGNGKVILDTHPESDQHQN